MSMAPRARSGPPKGPADCVSVARECDTPAPLPPVLYPTSVPGLRHPAYLSATGRLWLHLRPPAAARQFRRGTAAPVASLPCPSREWPGDSLRSSVPRGSAHPRLQIRRPTRVDEIAATGNRTRPSIPSRSRGCRDRQAARAGRGDDRHPPLKAACLDGNRFTRLLVVLERTRRHGARAPGYCSRTGGGIMGAQATLLDSGGVR